MLYLCIILLLFCQTDEWENALGSIRWAAEYFIKCHVSDYELYGQVGDFNLDLRFWGRAEDMNMSRPAFKIDKNRPGKRYNITCEWQIYNIWSWTIDITIIVARELLQVPIWLEKHQLHFLPCQSYSPRSIRIFRQIV